MKVGKQKVTTGPALYLAVTFLGTLLLVLTGRQSWLIWFLPLVFLAAIPLALWDGLKFQRLFHAGKVEDAFRELARRERNYARNPRIQASLQLNRAQLYTNLGEYGKSGEMLEGVSGRLDKNAEGMRLGLKSFNTFMTGGDLTAAHQDLLASLKLLRIPQNHLLLAVIERELGRAGEAEASIRFFLAHKNRKRFFTGLTLLVVDQQLSVQWEQYLLGRYYLASGEPAEARHHLGLAAQASRPSLYTKLAEELLARTG
ncbi:hypothetical protein ACP26L_21790 [Paenibacillus sp. S-38]|uniref:hypothetical protein n=1 Tax=Paenibacillus sp. S-38 TaxID=3416710 RepID=UPI003CEE19AE